MPVQRNFCARACSGPGGPAARRATPALPTGCRTRAFEGRGRCRGDMARCRTVRATGEVPRGHGEVPYGQGDGRRGGLAPVSPPSLQHCVAQPATDRSWPTHRFHPRTPGPPLFRPTGTDRSWPTHRLHADRHSGCILEDPPPRRSPPPAADGYRRTSAGALGAVASRLPGRSTPHGRGWTPCPLASRARQPDLDPAAAKATTPRCLVHSNGRYPSPIPAPVHTPLSACRVSGRPPQTPDTPPPHGPPTPARLSDIRPPAANTRHAHTIPASYF